MYVHVSGPFLLGLSTESSVMVDTSAVQDFWCRPPYLITQYCQEGIPYQIRAASDLLRVHCYSVNIAYASPSAMTRSARLSFPTLNANMVMRRFWLCHSPPCRRCEASIHSRRTNDVTLTPREHRILAFDRFQPFHDDFSLISFHALGSRVA